MLFYNRNKTGIARNIRKTIQTQSEWNFCGFSAHKETVDYFGFNQTVIVFIVSFSDFQHMKVSFHLYMRKNNVIIWTRH